MKVKWSTIH